MTKSDFFSCLFLSSRVLKGTFTGIFVNCQAVSFSMHAWFVASLTIIKQYHSQFFCIAHSKGKNNDTTPLLWMHWYYYYYITKIHMQIKTLLSTIRITYYQPAGRLAGPKITFHFPCLLVPIYLHLCIHTYHVHNTNYVMYIVAMRLYFSRLRQFRWLLCVLWVV